MATIGSLVVNVIARTDRLHKGLSSARKQVNTFASQVSRATRGMTGLVATFTGLAAGASAISALKKQFTFVDTIGETSDKLGTTVEGLTGLQHAAEMTGVSTDLLERGLQRMARGVSEAATGAGAAADAISELGLSAAALNQLRPEQQFMAVAAAMEHVANTNDRLRMTMEIFGLRAGDIVRTLSLGEQGLKDISSEAEKFGLVLSRTDVAKIEVANDAISRMKAAFGGIFRTLAVQIAPAIEHTAMLTADWLASFHGGGLGVMSVLQGIGGAVGVVGDVVLTLRLAFIKVHEVFAHTLAFLTRGIDTFIKFIVSQVNKIPGISLDAPAFSGILAEEMGRSAKEISEKFTDTLLMPTPSEQIDLFFERIEERGRTAALTVRDTFNFDDMSLPQLPGKRFSGEFAALDRGTAEAFTASRKSNDTLKHIADNTKKQVELQRLAVSAMHSIAQGFGSLAPANL